MTVIRYVICNEINGGVDISGISGIVMVRSEYRGYIVIDAVFSREFVEWLRL
jgi:hypothetical protein